MSSDRSDLDKLFRYSSLSDLNPPLWHWSTQLKQARRSDAPGEWLQDSPIILSSLAVFLRVPLRDQTPPRQPVNDGRIGMSQHPLNMAFAVKRLNNEPLPDYLKQDQALSIYFIIMSFVGFPH